MTEEVAGNWGSGEGGGIIRGCKTLRKDPMTQNRISPSPATDCLYRPYQSSQKGGTLIAADVSSLTTHQQRLADPNGYRPSHCPSCLHSVLHVHDYRTRLLQVASLVAVIRVIRHRCTHCGGRWQTLPAFVVRHLHYNWPVVLACALATYLPKAALPSSQAHPSPRTVRRWTKRLGSCGLRLSQLLATSARPILVRAAQVLGLQPSRLDVVATLESTITFAMTAALLHQLLPGVRLM